MPILEGLLAGIGTIIFIGPVLFTLLQITLDHGKKAGLSVALGIIASDILIVALFYFGAVDFFEQQRTQLWLAIAGTIILFFLGIKYILKPYSPEPIETKKSFKHFSSSFTKGFLVNFVNPFVFFVWIGLLTYAEGKFSSNIHVTIYMVSILFGIFITDIIKVLLAHRLQLFLRPTMLKKLFRMIGIILILFSFRLIYFIVGQI